MTPCQLLIMHFYSWSRHMTRFTRRSFAVSGFANSHDDEDEKQHGLLIRSGTRFFTDWPGGDRFEVLNTNRATTTTTTTRRCCHCRSGIYYVNLSDSSSWRWPLPVIRSSGVPQSHSSHNKQRLLAAVPIRWRGSWLVTLDTNAAAAAANGGEHIFIVCLLFCSRGHSEVI